MRISHRGSLCSSSSGDPEDTAVPERESTTELVSCKARFGYGDATVDLPILGIKDATQEIREGYFLPWTPVPTPARPHLSARSQPFLRPSAIREWRERSHSFLTTYERFTHRYFGLKPDSQVCLGLLHILNRSITGIDDGAFRLLVYGVAVGHRHS